MPTLITLRMRLPVCPFHAPLRTRSANSAMRSSTRVDVRHHVPAVENDRLATRRPQRHMQHGAVLGDIDPVAAKHGVDVRAQPRLLGQLQQQRNRRVGHAILRIVEIDPCRLRGQALAAARIVGEQLLQLDVLDGREVRGKRFPCRTRRQRREVGSRRAMRGSSVAISATLRGGGRTCAPRTRFRLRATPHPESAEEGVVVVAEPAARRQFLEVPVVAAAQDDVVRAERCGQAFDDILDRLAPFLLAESLDRTHADVVLVRGLAIRKVCQFHRHDGAVHDQRGAQPGTQAQEQHGAAPVAAKCLHGGIVDDFHRTAEGLRVVELHPPLGEIVGFGHRLVLLHHARITDRNTIVGPTGRRLLDSTDHLRDGH